MLKVLLPWTKDVASDHQRYFRADLGIPYDWQCWTFSYDNVNWVPSYHIAFTMQGTMEQTKHALDEVMQKTGYYLL